MTAPERIYHWLDSQLSIARFYGGIDYNGVSYSIALDEPGQPLVRADVIAREAKEARAAKRKSAAEQKAEASTRQAGLL